MLKINNLNVTTLKGRELISDFSFVLNDGEHIALIGEEGNGKSTLLKIIAGEDVSGYVNYSGTVMADETVGYLRQQIDSCWNEKTALQYFSQSEGRESRKRLLIYPSDDHENAAMRFELVGFPFFKGKILIQHAHLAFRILDRKEEDPHFDAFYRFFLLLAEVNTVFLLRQRGEHFIEEATVLYGKIIGNRKEIDRIPAERD